MKIEGRLRDAFGAAAGTVRPESIRPCPARSDAERWEPATRRGTLTGRFPRLIHNGSRGASHAGRADLSGAGRRPLGGLRAIGVRGAPGGYRVPPGWQSGSRGRALVPIMTAAAVAVIVAGATVATSLVLTSHRHPVTNQSARPTGAAALPRFFITSAGDGSPLKVHDTRTGRITGQLASPKGTFIPAVAGMAGDRTFIVAVEPESGRCDATLYKLRLNSDGAPGPLRSLGIVVPGTFSGNSGLAVTPDGRTTAYATYICGQGRGVLGVIDLATHQVRKWTTSMPEQPGGLSLTADGREVSFNTTVPAGTVQAPFGPTTRVKGPATYVLRTNAPAGPARARARLVLRSAGADAISKDGTTLYACSASGSSRNQTLRLAAYDASSARPLGVLHTWVRQGVVPCQISRDASGNYLLVRLQASFAVWHIPEGKVTALIPAAGMPYGESVPAIAW